MLMKENTEKRKCWSEEGNQSNQSIIKNCNIFKTEQEMNENKKGYAGKHKETKTCWWKKMLKKKRKCWSEKENQSNKSREVERGKRKINEDQDKRSESYLRDNPVKYL